MLVNWNKTKKNPNETPEMYYVELDESKTIGKARVVKKGIFDTSFKWARQSQSIARIIPKCEILTRVLKPENSCLEIEDISSKREFQYKIENELELQLKQTLDMRGLELLKFTTTKGSDILALSIHTFS